MAELLGGPADGMLMEVPDRTQVWVITQPAMTAAEFVNMENAPPLMDFVNRKPREHAYILTKRVGTRSGARVFAYGGERVMK